MNTEKVEVDMTKLTPAPWEHDDIDVYLLTSGGRTVIVDAAAANNPVHDETNLTFIALARNAFDVMMRRKWGVVEIFGDWTIMEDKNDSALFEAWMQRQMFADPFTALVEADAWYKANIE